ASPVVIDALNVNLLGNLFGLVAGGWCRRCRIEPREEDKKNREKRRNDGATVLHVANLPRVSPAVVMAKGRECNDLLLGAAFGPPAICYLAWPSARLRSVTRRGLRPACDLLLGAAFGPPALRGPERCARCRRGFPAWAPL